MRMASKPLTIRELLRPHRKALILGGLAAVGDGAAGLLQPWPLKIVFDNVLKQNALDERLRYGPPILPPTRMQRCRWWLREKRRAFGLWIAGVDLDDYED